MVHTVYRVIGKDSYKRNLFNYKTDINCKPNEFDFQRATCRGISCKFTVNQIPISLPEENEPESFNNSNKNSTPLLSSPPLKRLPNNDNKCNTDDTKNCDFSSIQSGFNSKYSKKFITEEVQKFYAIDGKIENYLQKLHNNGICDLGLEDISYGLKSSPIKYIPIANKNDIKLCYLYTPKQTEAILGLPKSETSESMKFLLVNIIKAKLINCQVGKLKVKVVILTPRGNASWLHRKLSTTSFKEKEKYYYIIIRVRRSFTGKLNSCLTDIL